MQVMPRIQSQTRVANADIFNLALSVISGDAQERARIAADLANNIGKTKRHDTEMMADQINYESKVPA